MIDIAWALGITGVIVVLAAGITALVADEARSYERETTWHRAAGVAALSGAAMLILAIWIGFLAP